MPPEFIYARGIPGTAGHLGISIHHVGTPGSRATPLWRTPAGRIQQIAVSSPIPSELIVYYLWGEVDDPDSGKKIVRLDLTRESRPPDPGHRTVRQLTAPPREPTSGTSPPVSNCWATSSATGFVRRNRASRPPSLSKPDHDGPN